MPPGATIVKHLSISGHVQGVGFRYYMQRKARELGVTGWVCNCRDGSVAAVVQGSSVEVEAMIDWARHGPTSAIVSQVIVTDSSGDYPEFTTRRTE